MKKHLLLFANGHGRLLSPVQTSQGLSNPTLLPLMEHAADLPAGGDVEAALALLGELPT